MTKYPIEAKTGVEKGKEQLFRVPTSIKSIKVEGNMFRREKGLFDYGITSK